MIRVKYIIPDKLSDTHINRGLPDLLRQRLPVSGAMLVVDKLPQIVHVFGLWNSVYAKLLKRLRRKGLPVVFTSIEGLSPLLNVNGNTTNDIIRIAAIRQICTSCNIIHVCGNTEKALLESLSKKARTKAILNSMFTSLTDEETMLSMFQNTYISAYEQNTKLIRESISKKVKTATNDGTIAEICSCLMYIRSLYISGCIPQKVLDDTTSTMMTHDYDETEMANVLKALKMLRFSSFCMSLLENRTQLTEGFMPIPAASGKIDNRMLNMIVE